LQRILVVWIDCSNLGQLLQFTLFIIHWQSPSLFVMLPKKPCYICACHCICLADEALVMSPVGIRLLSSAGMGSDHGGIKWLHLYHCFSNCEAHC
jgi:hypothetical protein